MSVHTQCGCIFRVSTYDVEGLVHIILVLILTTY